MIIQFRYLTLAITVLLLLAFISGCALIRKPYHRLRSYEGKVIDLETRQPLSGAVVLAVYSSRTSSPAGVLSAEIDAQETVTDEKGEFVLPEVKVMHSGHHGDLIGQLHIFKPGYGTLEHHRTRWTCTEQPNKTKCRIPYDSYIVFELPELKTKEERKLNLRSISPSGFIPYTKQDLLIKAIDEERAFIGYSTFYGKPGDREKKNAK